MTDQIKLLLTKLICTTEEAQQNTKVASMYLQRFNEAQRWHAINLIHVEINVLNITF